MNNINLITPPDILYNHTFSILSIYPSLAFKKTLQEILQNINQSINLYLYDFENEFEDLLWLINIHKLVTLCVIELDNLPSQIKKYESYLISYPNTYWSTKSEDVIYNKISVNRVYDNESIKKIIGEKIGIF